MPRVRTEERLGEIAMAATQVFGRLGYRRTLVAHVATEAGLSAGAVYTYVESKEALFHLVFAHGFGELGDPLPDLPLATPTIEETVGLIGRGLRREAAAPVLAAALDVADPEDVRSELAAIVEERFRILERLWPLLAVIERSAVDIPELESMYFQRGRRTHHAQLDQYLAKRAESGHLRRTSDPAVTARIIAETVTWFAWHRREDRDAALFEDDHVLGTIVEFVTNSLVGRAG